MLNIRNAVICIAIAAFVVSLHAQTQTKVIEEIVAKVNSEIVTLSDLNRELEAIQEQLMSQYKDKAVADKEFARVSKQALKNLIENKLMLQKAEEAGLTQNIDVEVAGTIEGIRKESGIPDMKTFEQALLQQGLTMPEYKDSLRKRLLYDRLIGRFVQSKILVTAADVNEFYQKNIDRFTKPAEVDLSEIVVLFEGKEPSEARRKAEQALSEIEAGKDFADVARKYSEGATAGKGGGVGAFKPGMMAPALEAAVFPLKQGQHTGIVQADYGLVILKLNNKISPTPVALEQVRNDIQREIYYGKMQPELTRFAEQLRQQSYVFVSPKYKDQYPVE